jgi:purine-binding chemotaxis protein CheW
MDSLSQLVVFTLDEQRYALRLHSVERIVRVVEITPLPKAPDIVLGVINVQGRVIPVVNIRKRFLLPERETNLSDQLIIAKTSKRPVAILTDGVSRVIEESAERVVTSEEILSGMKYVEGVVKFEDGMILIHDLDKFLSIEEEKILDDAMKTEIMVQESEVRDE